MLLPDVNVLVYAHRPDFDDHPRYARWLTDLATGEERFAMAGMVLAGFVRVVTNRRIFRDPTPSSVAMRFCEELLACPGCVRLEPGPRHWSIFTRLVAATDARGGLVADAWHAALAIEHGCTWVTADADFARFPGLRWRHPLQAGRPT